MTTAEIIANIDHHLEQLGGELQQLEQARAALTDQTDQPPTTARRDKRRTRRRRAKPAVELVPAGKLLAALTEADAMTTRELAAATNGRTSQILPLLKEQEAAGKVRRKGRRRSTRWQLVTDEDRIAARAAELARPSNRA